MKRGREERRVGKSEGAQEQADPANGAKFEAGDIGDTEAALLQSATLAHRASRLVQLVARNESDLRAKRSASHAVWHEDRRQISLAKPKGKAFQVKQTLTQGGRKKKKNTHTKKDNSCFFFSSSFLCLSKKVMGWSERDVTWLHPEEGLWLLDGGQLLLRDTEGRELPRSWLWQRLFCRSDLPGLAPQHYSAYQHLRSSGYPTRRWSRRAPTPDMSIRDPSSWQRMMQQEGGIQDGWIVFEVWAPPEAASFRRSNPPKSSWRILPWSIDADCGAAAAWNRAAGPGAMMALSGSAGTRCSFLEVAKCQIGANPSVPQARDIVLRPERPQNADLLGTFMEHQSEPEQSRKWFPVAQEWK